MRPRATFFDSVLCLLWAFLCFINLGVIGFDILRSVLGVVFGLVFGVVVALKHVKSIEKNGEFRATLKMLAFALLTGIILISIALYLLFSLGLEAGIQMASFIYPFIPALYAARVIVYLSWERRHKKLILFDGLVLTRVYAVPMH